MNLEIVTVGFLVLISLLVVLAAGLIVILATDHSKFRKLNAYAIVALMICATGYVVWAYLLGGLK